MSETFPARIFQPGQPLFSLAPFRALREEMDDLMSRFAGRWDGAGLKREFSPALDFSETSEAFEVRVDVPGMKPDDISIEVSGNNVRISGERKAEKEEKGKSYHRMERSVGRFCESLVLPCAIQDHKVQADFDNGVLSVLLPKTEASRTHKVKITAHGNGGTKK